MFKFKTLTVFLFVFLPTIVLASGFQIPHQSVTAVGLAGAHIAYTPGPDAAYYNPANMSFLSDSWKIEAGITSLYLPSIDYSDNRSPLFDGSSDSELFYLPLLHLSSNDYHGFRFGLSLTSPFGLAKSWDQPFPAATSKKFSLNAVELNPTASYLVFDNLSIGGGLRLLYAKGEVVNEITNPPFNQLSPLSSLSRTMEGDDIQAGYNLAATLRPASGWAIATTYRSEIELELDGDASLQALVGNAAIMHYNGFGTLELTLPAEFSLATSYGIKDFTFEVTWNRTFWSSFDELDFQYDQSFLTTPLDGFDRAVKKDWQDTNAIRFGVTYELTNSLTTNLGFAIDESPVPDSTIGFDLPDSDSYTYGAGLQYQQNKNLLIALSYMYQHITSRTVPAQASGLDGEFTGAGAHAFTVGLIYEF
ncbi:MAG: aromatic hydrocarbon degradation protein [Desulfobulbaceae bacterium]|nr:aromatic hydrocarbon degradation protein [Desulfobulbaceae bacterium]